MATVSHTIYSHYDPEDRELLEEETGQNTVDDGLTTEEIWQKEAPRLNRLRGPAPQFVPATVAYDGWTPTTDQKQKKPVGSDKSVASWYRSLTSGRPSSAPALGRHDSTPSTNPTPTPQSTIPREGRNKNNWFIMNVIQSEASSSTPSPSSSSSPAPTSSLAEMLSRDPPPLSSHEKYVPPVWLHIGPSNKGFGMLQRSGWNEGEALGPDIVRRKSPGPMLMHPDDDIIPTKDVKGKGRDRRKDPADPPGGLAGRTRRETMEVKVEDMDDVSELREVDVIDLTLSDADADTEEEAHADSSDRCNSDEAASKMGPKPQVGLVQNDHKEGSSAADLHNHVPNQTTSDSPYERKALLTPIATVLKSDRLGIGLKAKTVGPHKASQKRVTHNAAAMAAHVRAAEESRKRRNVYGRGKRGFERQHRREEEHRQAMIAYLKDPYPQIPH